MMSKKQHARMSLSTAAAIPNACHRVLREPRHHIPEANVLTHVAPLRFDVDGIVAKVAREDDKICRSEVSIKYYTDT